MITTDVSDHGGLVKGLFCRLRPLSKILWAAMGRDGDYADEARE